MVAFSVTNILFLVPLYFLVLSLGVQQLRRSFGRVLYSHADVCTYNMVVIELVSILGSALTCGGILADAHWLTKVGIYLLTVNLSAQSMFHVLTCGERYLAIVHPMSYRSLQSARSVWVRNATVGVSWLLSFSSAWFMSFQNPFTSTIPSICLTALTCVFVFYCCISALCVLIRPGPGERGGTRQRAGPSKLKAFHNILVILGVLVFRFVAMLLIPVAFLSPGTGSRERCGLWLGLVWFCLPSSLVLPLLFLSRARQRVRPKKTDQ
ncbi:uncharacterized protein [Antennarius striatus]